MIVYEDETFIAFPDIRPQAKQHYLIVTKLHIKNCNDLGPQDLGMLDRMDTIAKSLLGETTGEQVIGFHRSFATSIDHIHLHAFEKPFKSWYKENISYSPSFFFFLSLQRLRASLLV